MNLEGSTTRIPILMYHAIDVPLKSGLRRCLCVPRWLFHQHLWYLKAAKFTPITMSDLGLYFKGQFSLPKRPVVLTFDDGYENVFKNGFPALQKYGFTGTVYLVADGIGKTRDWNLDPRFKPVQLMDKEQILRMQAAGIDFGAHTFTHPHLNTLSDDEALHEISDCRKPLEELLGKPVTTFCYPYGKTSLSVRTRRIVEEGGYHAACTTVAGSNYSDCDPFTLKRLNPRSRHFLPRFVLLMRSS